jgi:hypothetical protein
MTGDKIIQTIQEQRAELLAALDGVPEVTLTKVPYVDWWTIKDLIGHITMWQGVAFQFISEYKLNGVPKQLGIKDDDDLNRYNKRGVAMRRDWSFQAVREEYETTHHDLVAAVESLNDADLVKPLPSPWGEGATMERLIAVNSYQHVPEHIEQIAKFKLKASSQ